MRLISVRRQRHGLIHQFLIVQEKFINQITTLGGGGGREGGREGDCKVSQWVLFFPNPIQNEDVVNYCL